MDLEENINQLSVSLTEKERRILVRAILLIQDADVYLQSEESLETNFQENSIVKSLDFLFKGTRVFAATIGLLSILVFGSLWALLPDHGVVAMQSIQAQVIVIAIIIIPAILTNQLYTSLARADEKYKLKSINKIKIRRDYAYKTIEAIIGSFREDTEN